MQNYSWPGNIRELRNTIERFVLIGELSSWETEIGGGNAAKEAAPRPCPRGRDR